ncbi:hypothetical protein [Actinacidiphila reveromycinica]|nr:hypothetical protein [Streptomyces sp. SN-593]
MNSMSTHGAVRVGKEPVGVDPARGRRMRWPATWAVVFLVLSGLLAWGAAETDTGDTQNVIAVLSTACFVFFCAALVHVVRAARPR